MKKKRNEIRSALNKRKRRNDAAPTKFEIQNHELTAGSTFYTVRNNDAMREKFNRHVLIKTYANEINKYQKQVQLQCKQLQVQHKQLQTSGPPNQKEDSSDEDDQDLEVSKILHHRKKIMGKSTTYYNYSV